MTACPPPTCSPPCSPTRTPTSPGSSTPTPWTTPASRTGPSSCGCRWHWPTPPADLALKAREQALLHRHRDAWLAPLRAKGGPLQSRRTHGRFVRGLVGEVWMPAGTFRERAGRLFAAAPVRSLRATQPSRDELPGLLADPHLPRLRELTLAGWRFGDWVAEAIADAAADRLPAVLDLRSCGLTVAGARTLAGIGPAWRPVAIQVLWNGLMTDGGLEVLAERFGPAVRFDR